MHQIIFKGIPNRVQSCSNLIRDSWEFVYHQLSNHYRSVDKAPRLIYNPINRPSFIWEKVFLALWSTYALVDIVVRCLSYPSFTFSPFFFSSLSPPVIGRRSIHTLTFNLTNFFFFLKKNVKSLFKNILFALVTANSFKDCSLLLCLVKACSKILKDKRENHGCLVLWYFLFWSKFNF